VRTFEITDEQTKKVEQWDQCKGKPSGAIGGRLSYIFTPTSLGVAVTVSCAICQQELDLTDYGRW
jgi:hypothetical protein